MTPVKFKEANTKLLGRDTDCHGQIGDLDVFNVGRGIISCWRPTLRERLSVLVFGRVWLGVLSKYTHSPVWVMARRSAFQRPEPSRPPMLKLVTDWVLWASVSIMCSITLTAAFVWILQDLGLINVR